MQEGRKNEWKRKEIFWSEWLGGIASVNTERGRVWERSVPRLFERVFDFLGRWMHSSFRVFFQGDGFSHRKKKIVLSVIRQRNISLMRIYAVQTRVHSYSFLKHLKIFTYLIIFGGIAKNDYSSNFISVSMHSKYYIWKYKCMYTKKQPKVYTKTYSQYVQRHAQSVYKDMPQVCTKTCIQATILTWVCGDFCTWSRDILWVREISHELLRNK